MDALLVIDMQESLLLGHAKFDLQSVVERINRLAARVRSRGGCIVFVQHDGPPGVIVATRSDSYRF
ncbi:MAG: isochorismatase family protein [Planctomycetaceae bacterium]|nr:isochorismatase family protein [Planctomycetaceae bacterium]